MDPADVYKKGVPEWLNSSLWSSSKPSTSLPLFAEKDRSTPALLERPEKHVVASPPGTPEIRVPETGSKRSEVSDSSASNVEEVCEVIETAGREDTLETEEIKLKDGENIAENKPAWSGNDDFGSISSGDDCILNNDHLQRNDKEKFPLVDESSDFFKTEGPLPLPLPLPLSSASSTATTFMAMPATRSSSFDSRVNQFNSELSKMVVSMMELQRLSSQGIPDSGSIRAITWKLLLGYLPKSREFWSVELEKKRAEYAAFKEELLVTPSEVTRRNEGYALDISERNSQGPLPRHDITQDDHPLSLGKTSIWHQYFLDSEVLEQIDRDVKRTHPDMQFFCGDSAASLENQEAMRRVLFIFSKLNPGIRYVQGMNEVLAPLYYVFKTDTDEANSAHAEADSFFCFVSLLGDFRDHFVQQLDNSAVGIRSTIGRLSELLKRHDEELWRHLEHISKVNPQFYAFRWITLLLTQEFTFPDSLRLWDSLLGNQEGPLEILLRVCCAMLMSVRSRLLAGDFTSNLKLLQHYPSIDVHHIIRMANDLKVKAYSLE